MLIKNMNASAKQTLFPILDDCSFVIRLSKAVSIKWFANYKQATWRLTRAKFLGLSNL